MKSSVNLYFGTPSFNNLSFKIYEHVYLEGLLMVKQSLLTKKQQRTYN